MQVNKGFWNKRRVIVTGHEGFLGSWVTKMLLESGSKVTGIDLISRRRLSILTGRRDKLETYKADISDLRLIKGIIARKRPQVIFHLAAEAIVGQALKDPVRAFRSNIQGTWNILEACRDKRYLQAIIVASSDKAYGSCDDLPYREETPLRGEFPYDVSKSCADLLAKAYYSTFRLPVCVVRCGNIYGPGDYHFSRLVPDAVLSAVKGKRFLIRSDGSFTRDYIYIEDAVNGYIRLAEVMVKKRLYGDSFNLSNEKPISVRKLVREIGLVCGKEQPKPRILDRARCEIHDQYLSAKKAKRVLGWRPEHSLREGLKKTIEWYGQVY